MVIELWVLMKLLDVCVGDGMLAAGWPMGNSGSGDSKGSLPLAAFT